MAKNMPLVIAIGRHTPGHPRPSSPVKRPRLASAFSLALLKSLLPEPAEW